MNKSISQIIKKPPYSVLAKIYDVVMKDVDYETWTDYIDDIILKHHPEAEDLLELACGTGTMAFSLEELADYRILATDRSAEMIDIAREKAEKFHSSVEFKTSNFLDLNLDKTFDVVYMVFDSLNYLHSEDEILDLHRNVKHVLNKDGIFIYDFTTPRNSRVAIRYLNHEEGRVGDRYRYNRYSEYEHENKIHSNTFYIEEYDGMTDEPMTTYVEKHEQKIYSLRDIEQIISKTEFDVIQAYDGFELKPAGRRSLRITMVLK